MKRSVERRYGTAQERNRSCGAVLSSTEIDKCRQCTWNVPDEHHISLVTPARYTVKDLRYLYGKTV